MATPNKYYEHHPGGPTHRAMAEECVIEHNLNAVGEEPCPEIEWGDVAMGQVVGVPYAFTAEGWEQCNWVCVGIRVDSGIEGTVRIQLTKPPEFLGTAEEKSKEPVYYEDFNAQAQQERRIYLIRQWVRAEQSEAPMLADGDTGVLQALAADVTAKHSSDWFKTNPHRREKLLVEACRQQIEGTLASRWANWTKRDSRQISEKLDALEKDWQQTMHPVAIVTRVDNGAVVLQELVSEMGAELLDKLYGVAHVRSATGCAGILAVQEITPEIASRMKTRLKSYEWVATTQNMDQADLPEPKALKYGANSKNVEYCKAMIQSRAGVLKGRPPPPPPETGGKAMPPPQPQVPTGLAEQVRLMDAKLQLLLDNQARMAKGAKALNPSEKKQEKPVPKQMVAMPIRADHNCSKYLLGFIKDLVKDKGAKLDQSPERLEITKRELVQHILDYLHDECKKDESVFMQHFGQAPQQYISKLLDGRGTDSWLGVPAFTAFVKKSPIELRLVLTREFDEKGQPDKSCGQIQIVGSPNQEKKTHVVFTMWNGSHFDLAQDTDGKKCFEIGEEADEAGKKLVAQIQSKAKLGEVLQRAVSAGDQAARTAALDEYCRAQRESSLNGKRSKKTSKTKQQKQPRKAKAQEGNPQPKHKPGVCRGAPTTRRASADSNATPQKRGAGRGAEPQAAEAEAGAAPAERPAKRDRGVGVVPADEAPQQTAQRAALADAAPQRMGLKDGKKCVTEGGTKS